MADKNEKNVCQDFTDETLMSTPQPRASSTTQKTHTLRQLVLNPLPINYSPEASNSEDTPTNALNKKLMQQRLLTSTLLKSCANFGLPSQYLKESDSVKTSILSGNSDSTVNETDLLLTQKTEMPRTYEQEIPVRDVESEKTGKENIHFEPNEISTPRNSLCIISEPDSNRLSTDRLSLNYITKSLADFSKQIKDSDRSLSDLCDNFYRNFNTATSELESQIDESFASGELALEKIAVQEKLWMEEHDVLGGAKMKDSEFQKTHSFNDFTINQPKVSVSTFFKKKSELADICCKTSPQKSEPLRPLISFSTTKSCLEDTRSIKQSEKSIQESVLGVTEIEKMISSNDNTARILDYILTKSKKQDKNILTSQKIITKDNSASKENQLPINSIEFDEVTASYRIGSLELLKDTQNTLKDPSTFQHDKSIISTRTVSSLDSLPNGKLPIECNCTELVWKCIKVGKKQVQTFILRNKSQNKLRLKISSSNPNFNIYNDHSETDSVLILPVSLYPSESRSFSVCFSPTTNGAFIDKLHFAPMDDKMKLQQTKRQYLMMYGYGGYSSIEFESVSKDVNMKMWLSLGKLDNSSQILQTFSVYNVGDLSAFCNFSYKSKTLYGCSKLSIEPQELILNPKERKSVTITYIPTKDDAKQMFTTTTNQITEIGTIHIISGEEVTRGRIRQLYKKLKRSGREINPLIDRLSKVIIEENIPSDVVKFNETIGSTKDLMQQLTSKEIALTMERDLENPLLGQLARIDDSSMFYSLCEGMTTILPSKTLPHSCTLEPTSVILKPPMKSQDFFILSNQSHNSIQYKVDVNPKNTLTITPSSGFIKPDNTIILNVTINDHTIIQQKVCQILVFADENVCEASVKIIVST